MWHETAKRFENFDNGGLERMADNQQSRYEKSLGLLTTRFVTLLQKAKDGVLDLKVVRALARPAQASGRRV